MNAFEIAAVVLILFFSIVLHEVSHGAVAFCFGDPTAKAMHRLTLNPLSHIDWIGTVMLPLVLFLAHSQFIFAWAKPVPYDPRYFRYRNLGTLAVAAAGPITNLALAVGFAFLMKKAGGMETSAGGAFYFGLGINLLLALFNLIPIPPLDGSKIVGVFLPKPFQDLFFSLEKWGMILIVALLFSGLLNRSLIPVYQVLLNRLAS